MSQPPISSFFNSGSASASASAPRAAVAATSYANNSAPSFSNGSNPSTSSTSNNAKKDLNERWLSQYDWLNIEGQNRYCRYLQATFFGDTLEQSD